MQQSFLGFHWEILRAPSHARHLECAMNMPLSLLGTIHRIWPGKHSASYEAACCHAPIIPLYTAGCKDIAWPGMLQWLWLDIYGHLAQGQRASVGIESHHAQKHVAQSS